MLHYRLIFLVRQWCDMKYADIIGSCQVQFGSELIWSILNIGKRQLQSRVNSLLGILFYASYNYAWLVPSRDNITIICWLSV